MSRSVKKGPFIDKHLLRKVELGRRNGLSAQVISGLIEGDTVITHPDSSIEDGTGVTPHK